MGIKCSVPSFTHVRHKCDDDYYFYGALKEACEKYFSAAILPPGFKDIVYTAHLKAIFSAKVCLLCKR